MQPFVQVDSALSRYLVPGLLHHPAQCREPSEQRERNVVVPADALNVRLDDWCKRDLIWAALRYFPWIVRQHPPGCSAYHHDECTMSQTGEGLPRGALQAELSQSLRSRYSICLQLCYVAKTLHTQFEVEQVVVSTWT
jgi:hypothetical protein